MAEGKSFWFYFMVVIVGVVLDGIRNINPENKGITFK